MPGVGRVPGGCSPADCLTWSHVHVAMRCCALGEDVWVTLFGEESVQGLGTGFLEERMLLLQKTGGGMRTGKQQTPTSVLNIYSVRFPRLQLRAPAPHHNSSQ